MNIKRSFLAVAGGLTLDYLQKKRRERRRIDFYDKTVLITGGSRGLGLELARWFGAEGARLALLARNQQELERARSELADRNVDVATFPCDVSDRPAVQGVVQQVRERFGPVDVLVNNAGVIQVGPLEHMEPADFKEAMEIHFWGAFHFTEAIVPMMKERGEGRIVNISSIGGLVSVPHLLPYAASKFALTGFSDGLRSELDRYGIKVTTVCPGLMRTGSHVNAFFKGKHPKEFSWFTLGNAMPFSSTTSAHAANQIIDACRHGDKHLTITLPAKLLRIANGVFPSLVGDAMKLTDRLLPKATDRTGDYKQTGWESPSPVAPSPLTRLADEAIEENNEDVVRSATS